MPNEESVIVLISKTAIDKNAYRWILPWIYREKDLFPVEIERKSIILNATIARHIQSLHSTYFSCTNQKEHKVALPEITTKLHDYESN